AAIGLLRHWGDPVMLPPGLYLRNLGEPNQLFHLVGWALSYALSTRWTVKVLVAAAVTAIPVSSATLARYLGRSPLAALAVAPMALGWLFSWGLVANLIGLACLLPLLPALDRYAARPTPRGAIAALGGVGLLFLAHEAMMFVYGLMAALLAALAPWSWRRTPARLLPALAVLGVHAASIRRQAHFLTPAVSRMPVLWNSFWQKIAHIPYTVLPATDRPVLLGMVALCAVWIGSFLWVRRRERRDAPPGAEPAFGNTPTVAERRPGDAPPPSRLDAARAALFARRFELLALTCFVAYLAFPASLSGATFVYQRFFPPAYAVFALTAAPRDLWTRLAQTARVTLGVLPVATLLVALPAFADSDRVYRELEALLPLIAPGSAIASIDLGPGDPTRTYSLGTAGGRALATRGGRLAYAFTDSPISPVVVDKNYQWNGPLIRIGLDSWSFRPAHDFTRFRYLLVRAGDPRLAQAVTYVLRPEADYVDEAGEWILFRSRLEVVPLKSPEAKLPKPPPESLRERIYELVQDLDLQVEAPTRTGDAPPTQRDPAN
ncbi:MAG: hypothetical protein JOZ69_04705, partial [Myxococcales bacterium]|nr:hypothetical protein [Myxococcales bacterium]